jgi:peptide deformylase
MKYTNGIGIAAPQIGILKRIIVMEHEGQSIKVINPEIVEYKGRQEFLEGCLSVGNDKNVIGGWVERPYEVKVKALDETGKKVEFVVNEMLAVMFSHEIDHLDGIMFTDKVKGELLYFDSIEARREYRNLNPRKVISRD